MIKAINIENSSKNVARVLSIAEPEVIDNNPTGLDYILIDDFIEPPELANHMSINYPMYDIVNKKFKWVQIQYQNTATEELLQIENLREENASLNQRLTNARNELELVSSELTLANDNINMLIEFQADMLGGAI